METVTSADGTRIAFERSGSGLPLILVHGTTADHTRWNNILPALARDHTVMAMDRRGRGGSGDTTPYSLEREYDDVAAVVGAAGPGAILLGHSFGALCAMEAALTVGTLHRLILYEPPFTMGGPKLYPPNLYDRLDAMLAAGDRAQVLDTFFTEVVGTTDAQLAALQSDPSWPARLAAAHTLLREMADEDYDFQTDRFTGLDVPTLLLCGDQSPPPFLQATEALNAALPDSRIAVLKGQGHVAMTTAPDLFLREIKRFLAG